MAWGRGSAGQRRHGEPWRRPPGAIPMLRRRGSPRAPFRRPSSRRPRGQDTGCGKAAGQTGGFGRRGLAGIGQSAGGERPAMRRGSRWGLWAGNRPGTRGDAGQKAGASAQGDVATGLVPQGSRQRQGQGDKAEQGEQAAITAAGKDQAGGDGHTTTASAQWASPHRGGGLGAGRPLAGKSPGETGEGDR